MDLTVFVPSSIPRPRHRWCRRARLGTVTPREGPGSHRGTHCRRVLILAGDASGNLGDRGIVVATCHTLRSIDDEIRITVVAREPSTVAESMVSPGNVEVIPAGIRGLPALRRAAADADIVLCGGGGLFQDDDSLVKMPYWAGRVWLARRFCPSIVGCSLGVGPLDAPSSRWFARETFARMDRISARDPLARRLAAEVSGRSVELVPDPSLLLPSADPDTCTDWLREQAIPLDDRVLIGAAPRRYFSRRRRLVPHVLKWRLLPGYRALSEKSGRLAGLFASVLDDLIEHHQAYVLLLPSYARAHEGDVQMSEEIRRRMHSRDVQVAVVRDPSLYKGITGRLDLMIGGRMHPTIFASASGTSVVGLAYNPKFHGFFQLLGQDERILDVVTLIRQGGDNDLLGVIEDALSEDWDLGPRVESLRSMVRGFFISLFEEAGA